MPNHLAITNKRIAAYYVEQFSNKPSAINAPKLEDRLGKPTLMLINIPLTQLVEIDRGSVEKYVKLRLKGKIWRWHLPELRIPRPNNSPILKASINVHVALLNRDIRRVKWACQA